MYVFDTNAFSQIFHSYYPARFPTLWTNFEDLLADNQITSTREVGREIEDDRVVALRDWAKNKIELFPAPTAEEGAFVAQIFTVPHFQQVIEEKKLYRGGRNADPFIVARASVLGATVVTMERKPKNGARIPNICDYFHIDCTSLEGFMEMEGWTF